MARWHRVNAKMEALQAFVALVQDLVLGDINELSSLVESRQQRRLKIGLTRRLSMGSGGGPNLLWLLFCHTFLNWNPS
jgi:hypothetical protein